MNSRKRWPNLKKNIFIARVATALPPLAPVLFVSLTGAPPCHPQHLPSTPTAPTNPLPPQVPDLSSSPLAALRRAGHNAGCTATLHQHPPPSAPTQRSCRSPAAAAYYAAAWPRSNVERKVTRPRCGPARPSVRILFPTKRFL